MPNVPCYRCGRVQTDPVKGASPWGRGVVENDQILVCPVCQEEHPAWTEELRTCSACGSTRLSITMGSIVCRACGHDGSL
jgi:ssDNA-binding Zn-finger/Zn-ribbon topoisomerase 1